MSTTIRLGRGAAVTAVLCAAAVAVAWMVAPTVQASTGPQTLADVAEQCAQAEPGQVGVATVDRELRDANVTVDLPDCVIHLASGADVTLNNVTITGGVINLHDRESTERPTRVRLQNSTIDSEGLLVDLVDADDSFRAERLRVTAERGISFRSASTRDGSNAGGSITLIGSSLHATGPDAAITVSASDQDGTVNLNGTTVDTRGPLVMVAADCQARLQGERVDCSTESLVADLEGR